MDAIDINNALYVTDAYTASPRSQQLQNGWMICDVIKPRALVALYTSRALKRIASVF